MLAAGGRGVGFAVGRGVGTGVGRGVARGVGRGVGRGVVPGVGRIVGTGDALKVGRGVTEAEADGLTAGTVGDALHGGEQVGVANVGSTVADGAGGIDAGVLVRQPARTTAAAISIVATPRTSGRDPGTPADLLRRSDTGRLARGCDP